MSWHTFPVQTIFFFEHNLLFSAAPKSANYDLTLPSETKLEICFSDITYKCQNESYITSEQEYGILGYSADFFIVQTINWRITQTELIHYALIFIKLLEGM